jgi:uncharacterized membrane protein
MYNIVGALFKEESEARTAMAALSEVPQINGTTIYQISLVKRVDGVLKLCNNFTSEHLKSNSASGGLVGGLIGLLAGPVGMLLGGVTGALMGKADDLDNKDDSAALIEQAAQKLEEGDIALIILAEETKEDVLDHALVKYNTVVVRYDADVIAKELEEAEKIRDELARQAHEALRASEEKGE